MGGHNLMKEKPVLLLAETGFIIRNLLLGHFADEISKKRKLIVAVQHPNDPNLLEIVKERNIELIPFPFEPYTDTRNNWQRLVSWDNLIYGLRQAKKNNESLKIQSRLFEGVKSWKKSQIGRISLLLGKVFIFLHLDNLIEDYYINKYIARKPITLAWIEILKEIKPEVLFSSMLTHSLRFRCSTDLPMIVAARMLGIKTCCLVQSWDNLSSKTSILPQWVDRYYSWSQTMSEELLSYNKRISPSQVEIVGSPQFDFHLEKKLLIPRDEFLRKRGLNPDKTFVLIGTGTATWMPDEMEKMVQLCRRIAQDIPEIQVLIRLHPKDSGERWEPFKEAFSVLNVRLQYTSPSTHMDDGGFIPPLDYYREQINTIYYSSVVINSSSSLTVDAAILDKPVICIAYDLKPDPLFPEGRSFSYSNSTHFSKLVKTGGAWIVTSEDACIEAIRAYLINSKLFFKERVKLVETVVDQIKLKAGKRLSKSVLKLSDDQTSPIN